MTVMPEPRLSWTYISNITPPAITRASRQLRAGSLPEFFQNPDNQFGIKTILPYNGKMSNHGNYKAAFLQESDARFEETGLVKCSLRVENILNEAEKLGVRIKDF